MRLLFVVPPFTGHVNPTVAVGAALERRGHAVAWAGPPGVVERLLPPGARFLPAGPDWDSGTGDTASAGAGARSDSRPDGGVDGGPVGGPAPGIARHRSPELRGVAAFKFLWEEVLLPLGHAMVDGVDAAVDAWRPDVLVTDQQALAGAAVARRRGLPWATSATTSAELVDPLATVPRVRAWLHTRIAALVAAGDPPPAATASGIPAAPSAPATRAPDADAPSPPDPRCSPHLVLVFSTPRLVDPARRFPPHYAFVGPSLADRRQDEPFPWHRLDPERSKVLVTLGTVNADAGARFFATAAEALSGEPGVQAIVVAPPATVGAPPAGAVVQPRVPQLALLPHLDAVICHAGHNTVCETLAHGVPLVVAPIRDDQPMVAEQVVRAGAGVRVRFGRVGAEELRRAVRQVLDEPGYRAAAAEVARSFAAAGGPDEAARRLEALGPAARRGPGARSGPATHPGGAGPGRGAGAAGSSAGRP